jgi:HK97 family phage prohead protease
MKTISYENFYLSTDDVVDRGGYAIKLMHHNNSISNMQELLSKGLNILEGHDPLSPAVGKVTKLAVDGRGLSAFEVALYNTAKGSDAYEMLSAGYDSVSVGVTFDGDNIEQSEIEIGGESKPLFTVNRFSVEEVSLVGVPANKNVGVFNDVKEGKITLSAVVPSNKLTLNANIEGNKEMTIEKKAEQVDVNKIRSEALAAERGRISEIGKLGKQANQEQLAAQAIDSGATVEQFNASLVAAMLEAQSKHEQTKKEEPLNAMNFQSNIAMGMPTQAEPKLSIAGALRDAYYGRTDTENFARIQRTDHGILLPFSENFAMDSTVSGRGLEWVRDENGGFVEGLNPTSILSNLNVRRETTGIAANYDIYTDGSSLPTVVQHNRADGAVTASNASTDKVSIVPVGYGAEITMYANFMQDTGGEQAVRRQLNEAYGQAMDNALISMLNTAAAASGNETPDWTLGAPTYDQARTVLKLLTSKNVNRRMVTTLMSGELYDELEATERFAGTGMTVVRDGRFLGRPVVDSNIVADDSIYAFDASKIVVVNFGAGLSLKIDDTILHQQGAVKIKAYLQMGMGVIYSDAVARGHGV